MRERRDGNERKEKRRVRGWRGEGRGEVSDAGERQVKGGRGIEKGKGK